MNPYKILILNEAFEFVKELSKKDRLKVEHRFTDMRSGLDGVHTKLLKNPIRELIVRKQRILFFIEEDTIVFVSGFTKKTQKAPAGEIEYAESIYKLFIQKLHGKKKL